MKHTILVGTDFSANSFDVIHQALEFAQTHEYDVHIVHILEERFFAKTLKGYDTIYEHSFNELKAIFPQITQAQFHIPKEYLSLDDGIKSYVDALNASLVILGSSGERGDALKQLLGSNIKSIVNSVEVPCLIIKTHGKKLKFENILIPTDLSEASQKNIHAVHKLMPDANLELLHSYSLPYERRLHFYGVDKKEILEYQKEVNTCAINNTYNFYESLDVDKNRIDLLIKQDALEVESLSKYALETNSDLISLHITGHFSFFPFDLLEFTSKDTLITKIF